MVHQAVKCCGVNSASCDVPYPNRSALAASHAALSPISPLVRVRLLWMFKSRLPLISTYD
jgi:hypothetical protein